MALLLVDGAEQAFTKTAGGEARHHDRLQRTPELAELHLESQLQRSFRAVAVVTARISRPAISEI
ncbi:MAG TPA: hypothetical protein VIV11_20230 [Kofleriaceae bacterium]